MKKITTALVTAALVACSLITPMSAKGVKHDIAYGSPKIDGKMDTVYKSSDPIEVKYSKGASYSTAKVYLVWDEKAICIFADVTDSTPSTKANTTNVGDIWKTDTIEWGLNLNPSESGDNHKISKGGIWLAAPQYGGSKMDIKGELNKNITTEAVTTVTATGWTVEAKLPVFDASIGVTPAAGSEYQFFAHLHNDTNDDNARDTETFMNSDYSYCAKVTGNMDYIVLAAKPANPATPAAATADPASIAVLALAAVGAAFVISKKR